MREFFRKVARNTLAAWALIIFLICLLMLLIPELIVSIIEGH